jgi:hypothetical protein
MRDRGGEREKKSDDRRWFKVGVVGVIGSIA